MHQVADVGSEDEAAVLNRTAHQPDFCSPGQHGLMLNGLLLFLTTCNAPISGVACLEDSCPVDTHVWEPAGVLLILHFAPSVVVICVSSKWPSARHIK